MAEIKYNADQHKQFQDELQKIGDGFSDLITELGNVKASVSSNLKGEAATALETALKLWLMGHSLSVVGILMI